MKKQPDLEIQRVLKNIRSHFDFLFQRGYQISAVMFTDSTNQDWNVLLAGENSLVKIHYQDKKIHLTLSSELLFDKIGMFDLHDLVDLMGGEGNLLPDHPMRLPNETEQLKKTAWLLENHMEDILTLFQRIHLSVSLSIAGELFNDNSPALLFYDTRKAAYVAPA